MSARPVDPDGARALVVDDHPLVRAGMRRTLEAMDGIGAVDEAGTGEAALERLAAGDYAVVLLDLALPGVGGVEVARRSLERRPGLPIVVVTGDGGAPVAPLAALGVAGWVTKGAPVGEIEAAVRAALAGARHFERGVAQRAMLGGDESPFERLSAREAEVARMVHDAVPNRRIAERLHLSEKTVSTHRTRAFEKLGIDSPQALVRLAIRHGVWQDGVGGAPGGGAAGDAPA